jgi:hypothetical protein
VVDETVSMGHGWDYTDRRVPEYWENKLSECHFFHRSALWTGLELNPSLRGERTAANSLNPVAADIIIIIIIIIIISIYCVGI